ncbi:hypothetical protein ACMFMG_009657 [Clarireedia jacksonii]
MDIHSTVSQLKATISEMENAIVNLQDVVFHKFNAASVTETETSSESPNTPTLTAVSDDHLPPITPPVRAPWAGETYMIRDRKSHRFIKLIDGILQLENTATAESGSHWICIEKEGWFGFRNAVSGMCMGHDGGGKFCCKAAHHKDWEWFFPRAHPDGGFWLMTLHWSTWKVMGVGENGKELIEVKGNGTRGIS